MQEEKLLFSQPWAHRFPDKTRVLAGCGWAYYVSPSQPTVLILDEGTMADFMDEEELQDTPLFTIRTYESQAERDQEIEQRRREMETFSNGQGS